jgi:hypothetical protein
MARKSKQQLGAERRWARYRAEKQRQTKTVRKIAITPRQAKAAIKVLQAYC